jgi:hypothetical protein
LARTLSSINIWIRIKNVLIITHNTKTVQLYTSLDLLWLPYIHVHPRCNTRLYSSLSLANLPVKALMFLPQMKIGTPKRPKAAVRAAKIPKAPSYPLAAIMGWIP